MPRRIPDYPDAYAGLNYICSMGSMISFLSTIIFMYVIYELLTTDRKFTDMYKAFGLTKTGYLNYPAA